METIIRKENVGLLVYSQKKKCYLLANKIGEDVIQKLISNKESGKDVFEEIDIFYRDELSQLGINDNIRVIDNKGKTYRNIYAPLEIYFDFTSKCNLRCPHCYNMSHLGSCTMSKENVSAIIEEMHKLGIMRLHLAGGEPTIEKKGVKNYVSTAKKYDIVTSMATNGTLLDDEMCKMLLDNNMFAISISIDGFDEETNSKRRGAGNFQKSIEGTKRLLEYRNKYNKETEICIKPIYTYDTEKEFFVKMIELAISTGVDKIKFANPERSLHHKAHHYGKEVEKYYNNMLVIKQLQEEYYGKIKITNVTNPAVGCFNVGLPNMRGCIGAQELLTINPDGRLTPCLMNDYDLGSYYDHMTIENFLNTSDKLKKYLTTVDNEECHSCSSYSMCRGGCQVRKIVEYGEIIGGDPCCPEKVAGNRIKEAYVSPYKLFDEICVSHSL